MIKYSPQNPVHGNQKIWRTLLRGRYIKREDCNLNGDGVTKQVFISGPILGMENNQSYRQTIKDICQPLGLEVLDPWNREKGLYKGTEECWWKTYTTFDFVERDLYDADRCDIMIVYLPILSAGACMEMFYAKRNGKHVIVVTEMPRLSPWIVVHSDKIIKSFSQLGEALKQFL